MWRQARETAFPGVSKTGLRRFPAHARGGAIGARPKDGAGQRVALVPTRHCAIRRGPRCGGRRRLREIRSARPRIYRGAQLTWRGVAEPSARRCLFCAGFRLRRLSTKVAESSKIGPTASANDYSNHARLVKQPAVQRVRNPERPGTKHSVLEPCRLEHSNLGRHTGTELKVLPTTGRTRRQNCLAYLSLRRARKTRARILESSVEQNPMVRVLPRFPWDFAKDQIRPYPIDPQEVPADFLTHFLPEPVYTRELRSVGGRQKRDQNPSLPRQPNVRASNAEHFWYGGRCRNCAAIHQQLTDRLNQTAGSADLPTSAPFARLDAGRDAAAVLLDAGRFAFSVSSQSWRVRTSCTSACWALAANRLDSTHRNQQWDQLVCHSQQPSLHNDAAFLRGLPRFIRIRLSSIRIAAICNPASSSRNGPRYKLPYRTDETAEARTTLPFSRHRVRLPPWADALISQARRKKISAPPQRVGECRARCRSPKST